MKKYKIEEIDNGYLLTYNDEDNEERTICFESKGDLVIGKQKELEKALKMGAMVRLFDFMHESQVAKSPYSTYEINVHLSRNTGGKTEEYHTNEETIMEEFRRGAF